MKSLDIKYCKTCNVELTPENFKESLRKCHKYKCSSCHAKSAKQWRDKSEEHRYNYQKKRNAASYGLTIQDLEHLYTKQSGRCAICGESITLVRSDEIQIACIDHNHATGQVRGLLCKACNRGIGYLKDNPEVLLKAANYLQINGFANYGPKKHN